MTGRWIAATDLGLTRAGAFLLRLESVELRDARHAWRVHPEHSLHVFAPGYLGVAGMGCCISCLSHSRGDF